MTLTFSELVRSCPAIAELKANAQSIAQNETRQWYANWLPGSLVFIEAVRDAAKALDMDDDRIRDVALTGLLDAYFTAKRRRAKREAAA